MSPSALAVAIAASCAATQVSLARQTAPDSGAPRSEIVEPGIVREHRTERWTPTPEELRRLLQLGKTVRLDPQTKEAIRETFTDHLPAGWILERPDWLPEDARVDSLGAPIVNDTPGLPAWSKRDVDALRGAIAQQRARVEEDREAGRDSRESGRILGNFIAQAITREIAIDDIALLEDETLIRGVVGAEILGYLKFYEDVRLRNQELFGYTYTPTVYPPRVLALIARLGGDLGEIQDIEPPRFTPGGQPSGCYARTSFARGLTLLSGQTDIWAANGFDDVSADIPTGLPMFFYYDCQNPANNDSVRVSTNGYLTFFQQGGGALNGTDFSNDAIPTAVAPDGMIAPWWDDLIVATSQGNTDRVSYKVEGAVDQRVFTVEWFSISRLGGSTTDWHFFQAKLFETSDIVELHYSLDWSADTVDSATCGIESYSGAGGDCGPNCTNTNAAPPPNDYRFTPFPRPSNDSCGAATELINGASVIDNLHRATSDGGASCGSSANNRDVWYTFVARCNGTLRADTCGSRDLGGTGLGVDTVLSVHSACPGTTANQLACSDDAGAAGCSANDSAVSVPMTAGQRVFIRVTHFGDLAFRFGSGAFRLNINFVSSGAPANDNCASAAPLINGQTAVGNLLCASNDGGCDCGSAGTNPDVWYSFTSPRLARLRITLCGTRNNAGADTGPDTVVSIHGGCPGTLANQLACNDDGFTAGCSTLDSTVEALVAQGQNVRIRVSHFGDNAFRVGNGVYAIHAELRCAADFNGDGFLDFFDYDDYVGCFEAGACPPGTSADFNGDGFVDFFDYDDFVNAFEGGC